MILEIDAGNSRIKWRIRQPDAMAGYGVLLTKNVACLGADVEEVGVPRLVRLSSVCGAEVDSVVVELAEKWGAELVVAKSSAEAMGVRSGYHEPAAMGVDRWLAIVAAYHHVKTACVVVDAGSAVTVDLLDHTGSHLGGYIVPGFNLMNRALFSGGDAGAAERDIDPRGIIDTSPGESTREAVHHGLLLMVLGLVEGALLKLPPGSASIVLTGGDAEVLHQQLGMRAVVRPDLVLEGLSLITGFPEGLEEG